MYFGHVVQLLSHVLRGNRSSILHFQFTVLPLCFGAFNGFHCVQNFPKPSIGTEKRNKPPEDSRRSAQEVFNFGEVWPYVSVECGQRIYLPDICLTGHICYDM